MIFVSAFGFKSITLIVIVFEVCADVRQHLIIRDAQKMPRADSCGAFPSDGCQRSDLCGEKESCRV